MSDLPDPSTTPGGPAEPPPARKGAAGKESLGHRALTGVGWTSIGMGVEMALRMVVIVVLARLLTPEDFGTVSIALVVIGFISIFGELGLNPALVQRAELRPAHVSTAFSTALYLALAIAAGLFLLAPALAVVFHAPDLVAVLRALSLITVIKSLGVVPDALLQRDIKFRQLSAVRVVSYVVGFGVIGIPLAFMGLGLWALVAAQLAQVALQTIQSFWYCPVRPSLAIEREAFRDLLAYGSGASLGRIANYAALKGDNLVVGSMLGPAVLGIYGRAYQLMSFPAEIYQQVVQKVLFPALSKMQGDPEKVAVNYRRLHMITAAGVLPLSAIAVILGPESISVLLGPQWTEVVPLFEIMVAAMFFRVGYKVSAVTVQALGEVHRVALRQMVYAVLVMGGAWGGARWGGAEGVAYGVVVALAVHYVLLTALGLRVVGLRLRDYLLTLVPGLILSALMLAAGWPVAALARAEGLPDAITLVGALAAGVAAAGLGAFLTPALVLGEDGLWWVRRFQGFAGHLANRSSALDHS